MSETVISPWDGIRRWFASTPHRTFLLYPLCVVIFEFAVYGQLSIISWGALFLLWGYLQFRLAGSYRIARAQGGPGMATPPEALVTDGPYGYTRNPMYLGHLIFLFGLALTFVSWFGLALFLFHIYWFQRRVREDEARLTVQFGAKYTAYMGKVKRWIPGIL